MQSEDELSNWGTQLERVPVRVFKSPEAMSMCVALHISDMIKEANASGKKLVLGLPTGSTPISVYRHLITMHQEDNLDFTNVVTFNLDEYYPMETDTLQSYHRFMHENLFDHINIPAENIHIPAGNIPRDEVEQYCLSYEKAIKQAGGLDLVLLGIGRSGHIGFNEPGSSINTKTRLVALDEITIKDAASDFFGEEYVPHEAITMGVGTIMSAKEVILMATGEHKAPTIKRAVEEEPSKNTTASFLQQHNNATFYVDRASADELTRMKTPWLVGEVAWDKRLTKRAVIWLSERVNKSIMRLEASDFHRNGLHGVLQNKGNVDRITQQVFENLRQKIVYQDHLFKDKKVICFSPHPDDDVISMGGMLNKVVLNENDVTVAYMTNGSVAVFDADVRRYLRFMEMAMDVIDASDAAQAHFDKVCEELRSFLDHKHPGEVDIEKIQRIKAYIRYSEAIAGIEVMGLSAQNARFLDMPFYKTGMVKKDPISEADIQVVLNLLHEIEPHHIFVAGDLSDPHGTHRMCYDAIKQALERYRMEKGITDARALKVTPEAIQYAPASNHTPLVWLYRGAWQEWEIHKVDVFIPMSKNDLDRKIEAVFKHESQKDRAMFPGAYDSREFWERARDRNLATAESLNNLGLPEFYVAEAYVTSYHM